MQVACTLLPLAVLKQELFIDPIGRRAGCMHPITACGIETLAKQIVFGLFRCMHPITACGIETVRRREPSNPLPLHAPYYRLRY